ncbi:MAG: neutral/alkaline non-lysosomal ceramidase N-terminal domain-containing protein [Chlamydiales bacterium]|nr:neutral/alkaline non-lysosomal ceramidase N-terminal domain-containing protein [Chlamydiales bacterium]
MNRSLILAWMLLQNSLAFALMVGTGEVDITPPLGTTSAGYYDRSCGMTSSHDPLLATAIVIETNDTCIALCGVDNLGFTHDMVEAIRTLVSSQAGLEKCEIFVGSSHTHSGGGAFLNIPVVGKMLAGEYNPTITQDYVEKTAKAIIMAFDSRQEAKIGVGYSKGPGIQLFRSAWPKDVTPSNDLTVVKITTKNDEPLAVIFNYAMHPTVLRASNLAFSADMIGYARNALRELLGADVQPVYFNGAQAEIVPNSCNNTFDEAKHLGDELAHSVNGIWNDIPVREDVNIRVHQDSFSFVPQATPQGFVLPMDKYHSEVNVIVVDDIHAFATIPGELSICLEQSLKLAAASLGYAHLSVIGLTNDAHGYILTREAWRHPTYEASLSFGGECHGEAICEKVMELLK